MLEYLPATPSANILPTSYSIINDQLYCLGMNNPGRLGVGHGDFVNNKERVYLPFPLSSIVSIKQTTRHTLILLKNGEVWLSGCSTRELSPLPLRDKIKEIVIGMCGYAFAITTEGTIWRWDSRIGVPFRPLYTKIFGLVTTISCSPGTVIITNTDEEAYYL